MPQGYIGEVKVALFILKNYMEESSQLHTLVNLPPGLEPLVCNGREIELVPELVWMMVRIEEFVAWESYANSSIIWPIA
jgi:hypothetical protein